MHAFICKYLDNAGTIRRLGHLTWKTLPRQDIPGKISQARCPRQGVLGHTILAFTLLVLSSGPGPVRPGVLFLLSFVLFLFLLLFCLVCVFFVCVSCFFVLFFAFTIQKYPRHIRIHSHRPDFQSNHTQLSSQYPRKGHPHRFWVWVPFPLLMTYVLA